MVKINIEKTTLEFINKHWMTSNTPRCSNGMSTGYVLFFAVSTIWNITLWAIVQNDKIPVLS